MCTCDDVSALAMEAVQWSGYLPQVREGTADRNSHVFEYAAEKQNNGHPPVYRRTDRLTH